MFSVKNIKKRSAMTKKRVMLSLEEVPYEELRAIAKKLGLQNRWLSYEVDKLVDGLRIVLSEALKATEEGRIMTEKQISRMVIDSVEKSQKLKLRDLLKE
jgi:hypothetical protein